MRRLWRKCVSNCQRGPGRSQLRTYQSRCSFRSSNHSTVLHMATMSQRLKSTATSEDVATKTPVHGGMQERQVSSLTADGASNRQHTVPRLLQQRPNSIDFSTPLPFREEGNSIRPLYGSFRVPRQKREPTSPHQFNSGQWDEDEQRAFLHGIVCFGWGRWKEIGTLVTSRSNSQIKSYGQKMAARRNSGEDIFEILKEPAPIPKHLPREVGDVLGAAQGLVAFKSTTDPPLNVTPQPEVPAKLPIQCFASDATCETKQQYDGEEVK